MAREITFRYSCNEMSIDQGILDRDFFRQFPNATETKRTSDGRPARKSISDLGNYLIFAGSAVLSSKVLAEAIKAWIAGHRRKIVVSIKGTERKIEYEGPNLGRDLGEIELMIDRLADESPERSLTVRAAKLLPAQEEEDHTTDI